MKNVCRFNKKYFPNVRNGICSICGGLLEDININEREYTRDDTADTGNNDFNSDFSDDFNSYDFGNTSNNYDISVPSSVPLASDKKTGRININGVILNHNISYENRFIIEKLFDGIVHGQPFSNTLHTFLVQNQENSRTYNVTAYGAISGRCAGIMDGQHVFISGKRTKNGIIFCKRMQVDSGGMMADIIFYNDDDGLGGGSFHRSRRINQTLFNVVFVLIAVLAIILAYNLIPAFRAFVALWIAMSILLFIIICMFFKRLHTSPPFLLGAGFVLALLMSNVGGIGTLVAANISAVAAPAITIGIMIWGIILIISSVFK